MKSKFLVSTLVLAMGLLSAHTMAQSSGGKTRAQVIQEMEMARKDGSFPMYAGEEPVIKSQAAGKTRQQVKDELIQAQKDGSWPMYVGEEPTAEHGLHEALHSGGEINLPPTAAGTRTRQSVKDELLRDQAAGRLPKQPDTGQ